MVRHTYSDEFMRYAAEASAYSARAVISVLRQLIWVESVLDVGCAHGTWLRAWSENGVTDFHGVDGDYVDRCSLEIPASKFTAANLNLPFDLGRQFDLVHSLEVGEHIEGSSSETFIDNIARHARQYILFSAAPPGQGGEYHVNERPYEFWRQGFEKRGFITTDLVRLLIANDKKISYWYRFNSFLFIRRELASGINENLRKHILLPNDCIRDVSPILFRLRKAVVRRLPATVQNKIARFKANHLPTGRI